MTAPIRLRGITWQHRRAVDPLLHTLPLFRAREPDIEVTWEARPLHGFEFDPVHQLAEQYDLIILDHPFAGEIAARRSLLPIDAVMEDSLAGAFVGPSLQSYQYAGHSWALPVDAACQVAAYRPDLLAALGAGVPQTWDEVFALGDRAEAAGLRLAIALHGVHSLMTFFTLCANQGSACATDPREPFVIGDVARRALATMRRLLAYCPHTTLGWNSIVVHDALVASDDLVYCPAVYCYAAYAEADVEHPLRFADLPGLDAASPAGSTLGGTGIGISARTEEPEAALAYVRFLAEAEIQRTFAAHHGQPARREPWEDPAINARFGDCFRQTRATVEQSWIRPRYDGYLAFQKRGGELIEAHLRGEVSENRLLDQLAELHRASVAPA